MSLIDLGRCCECGTPKHVRNLIALDRLAPVPGTGWGCAGCGLAANGAIAALCDECIKKAIDPTWHPKMVCHGYPLAKTRCRWEDTSGSWKHDPEQHPGEEFPRDDRVRL